MSGGAPRGQQAGYALKEPDLSGGSRKKGRLASFPEDRNFSGMTDVQFAEEILEHLRDRNPRFHGKAYVFLLSSLHAVLEKMDEPRHISGRELAQGVRDLALARYGLMARTVLEHWGIHSTDDLGEIVFAMVDCGVLTKREEDRLEDFRGLYDFEEVFEREYPWTGRR